MAEPADALAERAVVAAVMADSYAEPAESAVNAAAAEE
jgi:hypothetical protein